MIYGKTSYYLISLFKINETDDACEAFETLIQSLHSASQEIFGIVKNPKDDRCNNVWCLSHDTFQIDYEIIKVCKCGLRESVMKSDPLASYALTIYPHDIFLKNQHSGKSIEEVNSEYYKNCDKLF